MTPAQFITKWRKVELRERQAAHEHFLDLCELLGHEKPAGLDPLGESFCFERGARKLDGSDGWADVWKRGFFGWEYKGKHKDLDAAYRQLVDYSGDLENPPLLVTCDTDRFEIHTNFTYTKPVVHKIPLEDVAKPQALEVLRAVFFDPEKLRPGRANTFVTEQAAQNLGEVAQLLRGRGVESHAVARFLDRIVFCLFAEDVGLLPEGLMGRLLDQSRHRPELFPHMTGQLFATMAKGGIFGTDSIRHFNGNLFDDAATLDLSYKEIERLHQASRLDWSAIDASIFGTLFERGMDPDKRSQLGLHYTSRADIETLVEPVVMQPLRREWAETKRLVGNLLATGKKEPTGKEKRPEGAALRKARGEAEAQLDRFLRKLSAIKVLDPACGSGNFLFVTLQKLKDLEKEVVGFAIDQGFPASHLFSEVGPWQLYGIEISSYAYELAQMTVWIGYLQWLKNHGQPWGQDPLLEAMDNFEKKDAILDLSDPANAREPEWPKVDFIVGNPPFLGDKLMRGGLGDNYVEQLRALYAGRLPGQSDLCCYWFEKARAAIEKGHCQRAGLLATQGIRGAANREVLKRIKNTGDIFFAVSDRTWILDGASVHVSLVGFDDRTETTRTLDGRTVADIPVALTELDLAAARTLQENTGLSFIAPTKGGPFDISDEDALAVLQGQGNPNKRPNSDVVVPLINAHDMMQGGQPRWLVDFSELDEKTASFYEQAFELVKERVWPLRKNNRDRWLRDNWWKIQRARPVLRSRLAPLKRYLATPRHSKHRVFAWFLWPIIADDSTTVFALDDDFSFGILHSRPHEVWSRVQGTQVRERESGFRYTPTTCFETFPLPWPAGKEPAGEPRVAAIARAAEELDELRRNWLNPAGWVTEEILEFPGSVEGPWKRYVHDPEARGIGTVRYPRLMPRDEESAELLKKQTLTNLYNQRPAWLANAHRALDEAVAAAYDWPADLTDDQILEHLLALNLERAAR